jgi:hypothetical protein
MLLQRVTEAPTAEKAVTIAATDLLDLENPGGLEVGQNPLHGALRDPHQ